MVKALEGLVGGLQCLPIVEQAVLGGKEQEGGDARRQATGEAPKKAGNGIQVGHKRSEQSNPPRPGYRPLYAKGPFFKCLVKRPELKSRAYMKFCTFALCYPAGILFSVSWRTHHDHAFRFADSCRRGWEFSA